MQIPQIQIDNRASFITRYSNQSFYSTQNLDGFDNQNEDMEFTNDQLPQLQQVFEVLYSQRKENQSEKFYNMPNQERMYYIMDKDSCKIFDMRIQEQAKQIQEIISGNKINFIKDQAWQDFIILTKKVNENLLDYAKLGDLKSIEKLMIPKSDYYLNVDTKGSNDWTPLHLASNNGYLEIVRILLKNGATVDTQTKLKRTPFFLAVIQNFIEIANLLLLNKANINIQDNDGNTPLHIICQMGQTKIIEYLLDKKADPNIRNIYNQNCIEICCDANSLQIFQRYGYTNQKENYERTIIPGTNNLLKNSRYDRVMNLIITLNQTKVSTTNNFNQYKNNNIKKISKFQNLTNFIQNRQTLKMFNFYQNLGEGLFGQAYLVNKIGQENKKLYVMKIIKKEKLLQQNLLTQIIIKKEVLSTINHSFIVKLNDTFETESNLFLVMDYYPGGQLLHLLQLNKKLSEEEVKIYAAELLLAIECFHKNNIMCIDLNLENILIDSEGHVKILDFGLSNIGIINKLENTQTLRQAAYLPPEILHKQVPNRMADWYGLGVIIYELLVGTPPYYAQEVEQIFENIDQGPLKLPKIISNEAKEFIIAILNKDPSQRLGANLDGEEIRQHSWFTNINWKDCYERKLKPPYQEQLKTEFITINDNKNKITGSLYQDEL